MKPENCRKCASDVEKYYYKSHKKEAAYWFLYGWRCVSCGVVYNDEDARTGIRPISEKELKKENDKRKLKEATELKDIFKLTANLGFQNYHDYIESDVWKNRRRKMILANPTCVLCCKKSITVHHRTYRNLGGEKEKKDLIPLCVSCHEYFHKGHKYNSATGVFDKIEI